MFVLLDYGTLYTRYWIFKDKNNFFALDQCVLGKHNAVLVSGVNGIMKQEKAARTLMNINLSYLSDAPASLMAFWICGNNIFVKPL